MSRWLGKSEWEIFGVSAQAASGLRRDIAETSSIHQQPAISSMRDHRPIAVIVIAAAVAMAGCARDNRPAGDTTRSGASASAVSATATTACSGDNGGLTLPAGFCATIFADSVGHARHIVVAPNGDVYANTWSGVYYGGDKGPPGGYLV